MNDVLVDEILHLAKRVDQNPEAVQEWFYSTSLLPHGKTALELVQAGRGEVVIAFLRQVLSDAGIDSRF